MCKKDKQRLATNEKIREKNVIEKMSSFIHSSLDFIK
jgi:hypothetical protein